MGIATADPSTNSALIKNSMTNNMYGLALTWGGHIGRQFRNNNPFDNKWETAAWSNPPFGDRFHVLTYETDGLQSEFRVRAANIPYHFQVLPYIQRFDPDFYNHTTYNARFSDLCINRLLCPISISVMPNPMLEDQVTCLDVVDPTGEPCGLEPPVSGGNVGGTAGHAVTREDIQTWVTLSRDSVRFSGTYAAPIRYLARANLFYQLHRVPALRDSAAALDSFYTDLLDSNIGNLQRIDDLLEKAWLIPASAPGQQPDSAVFHVDTLVLAYQLNLLIAPENQIEQNRKELNRLRILSLTQPDFAATPALTAPLVQLAEQCPLSGGPPVHSARGWLFSYPDVEYAWNQCDTLRLSVDSTQLKQAPTQSDKSFAGFRLYPNPTTGQVSLELEHELEAPYSVNVLDLTGRSVFIQQFASENKAVVLDLKGLQAGAYLCRVSQGGRLIGVQKIVLIQ